MLRLQAERGVGDSSGRGGGVGVTGRGDRGDGGDHRGRQLGAHGRESDDAHGVRREERQTGILLWVDEPHWSKLERERGNKEGEINQINQNMSLESE